MEQFLNHIKTYWKTLVFFALVGLVGGFFVGIYLLDSYPIEIQEQILEQGITVPILGVITAIQSALYGFVLGAIGIYLAKKIGLWKDEIFIEKTPLVWALVIAIVGGIGIILPDLLFFGNYSQYIKDSYAVKPTVPYMIAMVLYGGVIEEVMLRLFMMSLVAFIIHLFFRKKHEKPTTWMLVVANVVSALLFAAGHLPTTAMLMGLTPMILFRCFLLNGGLGLMFGWLYRKFGLRYAMISHAGCHIISKLIWILFI